MATPTSQKMPLYQTINGVRFPLAFSPKCIKETFEYKPRDDDVLIVTYPKCGTTWMQNIVLYIFRKGQPLQNPREFFVAAPFMDIVGLEGVSKMPRPGAIKTHLPYQCMPYSPKAKYIFVIRNPRDACVSLYHHTRSIAGFNYSDATFDEFFELFLSGEVEYNDYCDHLLSWFDHRNDQNLFYTTYEDMKKDTKSVVHKVAGFLGKEYQSMVEKDNDVMENILKFSGYQYMKEKLSKAYDFLTIKDQLLADPNVPEGMKYGIKFTCTLDLPSELPELHFVRKGIVGDWKNYFSDEQVERLNKKCRDKFSGTDVLSLWEENYFSN